MLENLLSDLTGGVDDRAERAALAIGEIGPEALPHLAALLESGSADIRWWAVRALGELLDPGAAPLLKQALQDPVPDVRQCAARALIVHPAPALISDLIACLESGDPLLARLAGTALIAIGTTTVTVLIEVVEKGPHLARVEAVRALAELADPRAIAAFFHAVQDGDSPLVEYWAEVGLERLGIGMAFFDPG